MSSRILRSIHPHNLGVRASSSRLHPTRQNFFKIAASSQMTNSFATQVKLSEGQDETKVTKEVESLIENGWSLDGEQMGIRKRYYFKTYTKVLDLVAQIGIRSKSKNHHSVMIVESGSLEIHWTTHYPRGLSEKDTFMAQYCDERAKEVGTVDRKDAQKCEPAPSSKA